MRYLRIAVSIFIVSMSSGASAVAQVVNPGRPATVPRPTVPGGYRFIDTLPSPAVRDSAFWTQRPDSIRAALSVEIQRVLLDQRRAWQLSERKSHAPQRVNENPEPEALRTARVHCHREDLEATNRWSRYTIVALVPSFESAMSLCPFWIPADPDPLREPTHEYRGEVLEPARMVPFHPVLIAGLDSARSTLPTDRWVIGQLVRIFTENGNMDAAHRAASQCGADAGWCALLTAYTSWAAGKHDIADSLFLHAISLLPANEQCEWVSLHLLLPQSEGPLYNPLDCDGRKKYADWYWWLAKPLLSSAGNPRRAEHHARMLRNLLVNTLPLDAQYDLRRSKGQDAVTTVRMRYGWADHVVWGDDLVEFEHDQYLGFDRSRPYSAPEYATNRTSTTPSSNAIRNPLGLTDADFDLWAPRGTLLDWWPSEHYRHPGGVIVAFRYPQYALLQRRNSALLFVAGDTRGGMLDHVVGRQLQAHIVETRSPAHVVQSKPKVVRGGGRVVMQTPLTVPAIVGLEVLSNSLNVAAARTRAGVTTIPMLSALPAGGCALSDPVLVDPAIESNRSATSIEPYMLGSVALDNPTRVGVAWESYGFRPGDTTRVSIRVQRQVEVGRLRSFGMRIGVASDPRSSVLIGWSEPDPSRVGALVDNVPVPIVLRHINIDVSRLDAGDYRVTVEMQRAGCRSASNVREFKVLR